jgi:hypothetical protein
MTLGELKAELKQHGIRVVGILRDDSAEGVVVFFSSDPKIVFPFRPKNIYPLPMKSADDGTKVNSEKIEAIKRALIPDSHDET